MWLRDAPARATIVYHVGSLLADRQRDRRLDRLATYVSHHTSAEHAVPTACDHHARHFLLGSGELTLRQKRLGEGRYEYRAVKL